MKGNEIDGEAMLQVFDLSYSNDTEFVDKWTPVLKQSLETCLEKSEPRTDKKISGICKLFQFSPINVWS